MTCAINLLLLSLALGTCPLVTDAWIGHSAMKRTSSTHLYYRNGSGTGKSTDLDDAVVRSTNRVVIPQSVNYFISRKCNYHCQFCFHTQKTSHNLPVDKAKHGLKLLHEAGMEKINFAGGEPFLLPLMLGELCQHASQELGVAVSIISNGSLITDEWMKCYGKYVDVMGISVDSFDDDTNLLIGRRSASSKSISRGSDKSHISSMLRVRDMCDQHDVRFKLNTVVCQYNWQETMIEQVQQLDPCRWKVFQVLLLDNENTGTGQLRDARNLVVTPQQFQAFVQRHKPHFPKHVLIPEDNTAMQNSYLLLDEEMRFLDCSQGAKVPGKDSILDVGVERAVQLAGFDTDMFHQRGGIYDWKKEKITN